MAATCSRLGCNHSGGLLEWDDDDQTQIEVCACHYGEPADPLDCLQGAADDRLVRTDLTSPTEITHACPVGDSAFTSCCGRTPFELRADRMTLDPALVTCKRLFTPDECPNADHPWTPTWRRCDLCGLSAPTLTLWGVVAECLDAENHDNLCACILYPERCVTYGDKRPWSHSAERAVEIAVEIIYGLDADTAERVPLFNDDGTLRSVYEVRERAADIKNRSTK